MRALLIATALLALGACHKDQQQEANNESAAVAAEGLHKGVDRTHKGSPAPDTTFNDPRGKPTTLATLSGKPTLVNLWATWCAPCVKELPTLDRLSISSKDLRVVAISQDSGPHPSVVAFLQGKAPHLAPYQDAPMALSGKLDAEVLPTSILFDANGKEVWRYVGDLDWTSPEAAKLLSEAGVSKTR